MAEKDFGKQRRSHVPWSRWLAVGAVVLLVAMAISTFEIGTAVNCAFADGLSVQASAPEDGAADAPTKGEFWIEFDHNVAAVAANADCVTLQTADGKKVPGSKWSVELPDEQLEFGLRKHVIVKVKGLDAGKEYRIHLDAGLASKNGATLGADTDISFATAAKGARAATLAEPQETAAGSGNGNGTGSGTVSSDGEVSAAGGTDTGSSASSESSSDAGDVDAVIGGDATGKSGADDEDDEGDGNQDSNDGVTAPTVVMLFVIAVVLVAALALRLRKANANAPKHK